MVSIHESNYYFVMRKWNWPTLGELFGGCGRREENKKKVNWLGDAWGNIIESNDEKYIRAE